MDKEGNCDPLTDAEAVLAAFAEGKVSAAELARRAHLTETQRALISLTATVASGDVVEFERRVRSALELGITPHEVREMLLELADLGVRVPGRAFACLDD